jgi:imidazolonepropionase-like amidohydrolase
MNCTRLALIRSIVAASLVIGASERVAAQDTLAPTIVIRAATILDGRGGRVANGAVVVRGGRIVDVVRGAAADVAAQQAGVLYDLGNATVLPGLIDGHVHINSYFNAGGRIHTRNDGDTPAQSALAIASNLRRMLMSGVTTVQSMGAAEDATFRDAIALGAIAGPRLITTLNPITDEKLTPDSLRALVRQRKAEGADAIKVFASRSIREGGTTTMTAEQLGALCGEAKALGLRTLVHAHSEESMRFATLAGCTQIEHGIFSTPEVLRLMAEHGTYFDPQCGLIFRNYLENRSKYEGTGNFNEEGFAALQRGVIMAPNVIRLAQATPGLKLVWGTDAVAGAHGRDVEDLICRVREGGQPAAAALISATSGGAEALGLGKEIGTLAKGYRADVIAVTGDPTKRIEALRDVRFVMLHGLVRRLEAPARAISQ